ncbi:hypothetical protein QQS21_006670 [Conoideocrella luteorostrata]|uniref:Pierisin-like domain-containing protein n=1 Tax=Conoideocrella luteorostrata TaxID=1105319 RepID=A0AAJ0CPJ6_9HYPO|nr:hypothetical protein QQS21_006670 [Conoideocrella luteorostrata]
MRPASLLIGAALPWLRDATEEVAQEVFSKLDQVMSTKKYQRELTFRLDGGYEANGKLIPAAAEPLFRWDYRPPETIFQDGFQPRKASTTIDGFRKMDDLHLHLHRFINDQVQSIFVSTTRSVRRVVGSPTEIWHPPSINRRYCYEIFAHGGIDILATFKRQEISYPQQHEITFIGGIRSELIRTATEYNDRGQMVSVWYNTQFDPLLNGDHAPRLSELPNLPDNTRSFQILDTRADLPVEVKRGPATLQQINLAASAEKLSEHEFTELMASYKQKSQYKLDISEIRLEPLLKSYAEARKDLTYQLASPESKLWGDFGKLKKALIVAGSVVWVTEVIYTFTHNTTTLERTAAATEIIPFIGCGFQAASRVDKKKKIEPDEANDTALCLVADGLLISPLFPFGAALHVMRFIMSLLKGPDMPSSDEILLSRDEGWKRYLNDTFYPYLYSNLLQYPNKDVFEENIEVSLAMTALSVLSETAQAIGIIQAALQDALNSTISRPQEDQVQNISIEAIQALRERVPKNIISRQRQFLLDLPSTVRNETIVSLSLAADQLNKDIIGNITSTEMISRYTRYYTHPLRAPGPPPNNQKEVLWHMHSIADRLKRVPPSLPGHLYIAFIIGQSEKLAYLSPEILSPQAYLQEKAPDEPLEVIHTICNEETLQFARFLRGNITESQLSTRISQKDTKSTQELQTLLALKFGKVFRDLVSKDLWGLYLICLEKASSRELMAHPIISPGEAYIESWTYLIKTCYS